MTTYADVDPIIDAWAQATVVKLFTEWADQPARFAYLPGLRPLECFQIWIRPPSAGRIAVSAASVDTDDGSEHHQSWEGPIEALATMLAEATEVVGTWINRPAAWKRPLMDS